VPGAGIELGGDSAACDVVGGQQVRGLAGDVPGALDGLAVDGEVAQAHPAGGGFLAQPGAQRGVGLMSADIPDRALDGLQARGMAAAGALAAAQPAPAAASSRTFHGKGVFPDDHPHALGAVGFMSHDYVNFGFDAAYVIVSVGYELQEFDPVRINPAGRSRRPCASASR
jgi:hypothetical protein